MPHILPAPETSWVLAPLAARRSLAGAGVLPAMLAAGPLALAGAWRARSRPASRGGAPGALEFTARPGRVVLARHASGAWSVHLPADGGRRFTVPGGGTRRGGVTLDLFVLQAAARAVLPRAARALEQQLWKSSGRRLGLVAVSRAGLRSARLALAPLPSRRPAGRRLLLLHGTFSSTEHAFLGLATLPGADHFWRFVAERYPGGVFGFNHFSLCEDPRANARAVLDALGPGAFDAISHSRGGLVLRSLVESLADARARAGLAFGRAVLAAAPNEGTPLAAPGRRADLVALLVNLAEELTPAALGLGLPFAAAALAGLARGVAVALPGLAAMQPEGGFLHALNGPPAPPEGAYVALCAQATLAGGRLARFVDAGLGALFAQPHDLVVPTAGGWSIDAVGRPAIGADRIACFGPGGNLAGGAHHFNLFARAETADLLVRALAGEPLGLAAVDPQAPLATTQRARSSRTKAATAAARSSRRQPRQQPEPGTTRRAGATPSPRFAAAPGTRDALLDLFVIGSEAGAAEALLLACYRGARVLEPFARRGARWQRIVAGQRRLRKAALGEAEPPGAEALRGLGVDLFETLLPGDARRLYDEARGAEPQLEVRVTSTLDWVADAPWELAFDPRRGCALAADAHLARGVYSAIPADRPRRSRAPLRVLVVTASPRELPALSLVAEQRALLAALAPGALAGRVAIEVLARATPDALAARLAAARWDVVHFVGHGEHDVSGGAPGRLVFEDGRGGARLLDASAVRALLAGRGLALVFINACASGLHGRGDLARGVGPELARAGVPAVVAHQSSVLDASALRFARAFYESLARGRALAAAAAEARTALRLADHGAGCDWATPVVFLRT